MYHTDRPSHPIPVNSPAMRQNLQCQNPACVDIYRLLLPLMYLCLLPQVIIIKDTPHLKHALIMLYMDFEAVMGNSHPPSAIDWLSTFIVLGQIVVSVCCMAHFWLAFTGNGNKKSKNKSGRQSAAMLSWLTHQTKQSLICVSAT